MYLECAARVGWDWVSEFGMGELGPSFFPPPPQFGIWPIMGSEASQVSPELAAKIDKEISKIIDEGYERARDVLTKHKAKLDLVSKTLLEKETLERDEFEKLVGPPRQAGEAGKPTSDGEIKFKKTDKKPLLAKAVKAAQS